MAWTSCNPDCRRFIGAIALAMLAALSACLARAAPLPGESIRIGDRLIDALHGFQLRGIRLIFSSQVVTADMRVTAAPTGQDLETQLVSLLAPHHLELSPIPAGGWIIVPGDAHAGHRTGSDGDPAVPADHRHARESQLNEIIVEASRYGLQRLSVAGYIDMDRSTLNALPGTDEDIARSVQQIPGTASGGISARAHVRGGRDDETVFRYDGVTLLDPFHLKNYQGLFSALDPAASDSVNYWTGAFPIEFGGSIGGVVDVTPRRPTALAAEVGVSFLNTSLLLATPFAGDRGSILVSGRVSNLSNVIHILDRHIGEPEFRDLTARATWKLNDRTELILGALGLNDSSSLFSDDPDQRANAGYRDLYTWFKMRNEWTPDLRSETLITLANLDSSRNSQVMRPNINTGFLFQSSTSSVNAARQELTWAASPDWNFRLGGEFSHSVSHDVLQSDVVFDAPFSPGIQPIAHVSRNTDVHTRYSTLSGYGAVRWRMAPDSIVEVGLRRDGQYFQDENERSQWNLRINLRHDFSPRTTMRLAWGQFSQPEAVGRLDIADGVPDLASARRLSQINASIEHRFMNDVGIRLELYDKYESSAKLNFENVFSTLVLTPEIEFDRIAFLSTSARMRGAELSVQTDRSKPLSVWASYSYATAFDRIGGVDVPRSWSQPYSAQAGVLWKRRRWEFSGFVNWHSGWPYTPIAASSTTWEDPNSVTLALGPRNSIRHDTFQTINVRAIWTKPLRIGSLEASIEIQNVLNSDNECCRNFQVIASPGGKYTLVETGRDWLRLVPLLGIRWRL